VPDLDNGSLEGGMESLSSLKQFEKMHRLDPNLPLDELDEVEIALNSSNPEKGAEIEQILAEDNSPYPEVSRRFSYECRAALCWVLGGNVWWEDGMIRF